MKRIRIKVYAYDQVVLPYHMGLTRDKFTLNELTRIVSGWLGTPKSTHEFVCDRIDLQRWISRYAEETTANALGEMTGWFEKIRKLGYTGYTLGGAKIGVPDLSYYEKCQPLNTSALGAIGEGLAAAYLVKIENKQHRGLFRNIGCCPDLILMDHVANRWALVEVKTTCGEKIHTKLKKAAIELLDILAKTRMIRTGSYIAYAIGVVMQGLDTYEIHRLRMEEGELADGSMAAHPYPPDDLISLAAEHPSEALEKLASYYAQSERLGDSYIASVCIEAMYGAAQRASDGRLGSREVAERIDIAVARATHWIYEPGFVEKVVNICNEKYGIVRSSRSRATERSSKVKKMD